MLSQHTPISKIPTQAKHLISLSTPEASAIGVKQNAVGMSIEAIFMPNVAAIANKSLHARADITGAVDSPYVPGT